MKIDTRLYLRTFIISGIAYGIILSLWRYMNHGEINPLKSILHMVFFGGIVTLLFAINLKKYKQKKNIDELTESDVQVHQRISVAKDKPIDEIYRLLTINPVSRRWKCKREDSKILARTNITSASLGERILIQVEGQRIIVESKPILTTTRFDFGKNKGNVLFLKKLIEKED